MSYADAVNNARIENLKRLLPTVMPVYEQSVRNKGRVNKNVGVKEGDREFEPLFQNAV